MNNQYYHDFLNLNLYIILIIFRHLPHVSFAFILVCKMSDTERKICRYFNTLGGCWYGEKCKFIHLLNKKPPCKFFGFVYNKQIMIRRYLYIFLCVDPHQDVVLEIHVILVMKECHLNL